MLGQRSTALFYSALTLVFLVLCTLSTSVHAVPIPTRSSLVAQKSLSTPILARAKRASLQVPFVMPVQSRVIAPATLRIIDDEGDDHSDKVLDVKQPLTRLPSFWLIGEDDLQPAAAASPSKPAARGKSKSAKASATSEEPSIFSDFAIPAVAVTSSASYSPRDRASGPSSAAAARTRPSAAVEVLRRKRSTIMAPVEAPAAAADDLFRIKPKEFWIVQAPSGR